MTAFLFTATEASVDENEDALCAGAGSETEPYDYIMFQRHPEDGVDDVGIYFEFNDQRNSAYNCVRSCEVMRNQIKVVLVEPIDWRKQFTSVIVKLDVSEQQYRDFLCTVARIFRQQEASLRLIDEVI